MIIGKVWDCEYPWDVRVEKVTDALLDAGHEVHLFCRNRRGEALSEKLGRLDVHRMPNWPNAGSWLDDASSFPAFVNPRWARHLFRSARDARADVLLCRDLPLAPLALLVARRLGIPLVVDIAENYPAMLKHRFSWREFRARNLLLRNPALASVVERYVVRRADGVLAVVEESRDRLVALGAPAERTEVVSNTPTLARIEAMAAMVEARRHEPGPLRLVYLGLLGESRGIDVTLAAIKEARAADVSVHFDVIGSLDNSPPYRDVAAKLGISDSVTFHGHVPYDRALGIVAAADVGVVPHHATEHWRTTIPNKLFDYMGAGLPVVVSDAPPTRRVVDGARCGLVFRDRDARDLARCIAALTDPVLRRELGAAGHAAVTSEYNWGADAARLVSRLETVHRAASGRRPARATAPGVSRATG